MEIIHERPSQRLHYRVTAPMRVTLDGQVYSAMDWGLGGCRLAGLAERLEELPTHNTLYCTLPFQGFNITLKAEAEVIRKDRDLGEVAFRFTELGDRETALMQHFVEDLVRGKMTDVADTIVRIDTPVTPVPTKPDPNPTDQMPVHRWPIKQILMTLFYFGLGLLVFGYVGVYIFATVFRMEVSTAVVSANRIAITAPITGQITSVYRRPGDHFAAGSALATLEDTNRPEIFRRAKSVLAASKAELAETAALLNEERRRARGYDLVARNNVRQAESQLEGLELAKQNALLKVERKRALSQQGLARADDLETAELELKSVVSDLERKKIHIEELKELISGGDSVRLFTGNAFAGRLGELEARSARLAEEISYQEQVVLGLSQELSSTNVIAPFNGLVVGTGIQSGTTVKQGEPLFTIEEGRSEHITAFLTQDEILHIRLGSVANIFVPSEGRWLLATVSEVNRTAGFVDEVTETFRFRSADARSAQVTLLFQGSVLPPSGTPVTVYFKRHRNSLVWRTAQQLSEAVK